MRYGIACGTRDGDSTIGAVRTFSRLQGLGQDCSVFVLAGTTTDLPYPLCYFAVRRAWRDWIESLDVLFLFRPLPTVVMQGMPNKLRVVYVDMQLTPWAEQVAAPHLYADHIWVPSARLIPPNDTKRYQEAIWEPGYNHVSFVSTASAVLVPAWERRGGQDIREYEALLRKAREHKQVRLTFAVRRRALSPGLMKALRLWGKTLGHQLQIYEVKNDLPYELFTSHAMLYWPANYGGVGFLPLGAAQLGCSIFTLPVCPYDRIFGDVNLYGTMSEVRGASLYPELEDRFARALDSDMLHYRAAAQTTAMHRKALADSWFRETIASLEPLRPAR